MTALKVACVEGMRAVHDREAKGEIVRSCKKKGDAPHFLSPRTEVDHPKLLDIRTISVDSFDGNSDNSVERR